MRTAIVILLFFPFAYCLGQRNTLTTDSREVILNSGDSIINAHILSEDKRIKINLGKTYFWYLRGKINKNIGDYSGKLLDGSYQVFLEDRMILSGTFEYGLRNGKWISWKTDGSIDKVVLYKNGIPKDNGKGTANMKIKTTNSTEKPGKPLRHLKIFRNRESSKESVSKKCKLSNPEN